MGQVLEEKKMVPELRFSEFNEAWVDKKLGEKCEFTQGIQLPQSEQKREFKEGYIRYLYIRDFFSDVVEYFVEDIYPNKIIEPHEIMMVNTGNTAGKAFRGKRGVLSNNSFKISFDNNEVDGDFLFKRLTSEEVQRQIRKFFNTAGQPHLGHSNIAQVKFGFTSIKEQQKIASFLSAVDKKLNQLRRKRDALQSYKRGVMQKIFSQEIRFAQDNGTAFPDWEEKELGEVLAYEQPTKYLVSSTEYDDSFEIPVLTAGKTFILGYTDEQDGVFSECLPVIIFDDFTTAKQFVDFPFKAKSSAMKILKRINEETEIKVIYEFMKLLKFPLGEHKRYWISEYSLLAVPYPAPEEQQKIANFLSVIDQKIDHVNQQITQNDTFRKGLLQKMFV